MQVHPFTISLEPPLQTAAGPMRHRRGFIVRDRVGDAVGIGEATPLVGWTESLSACAAALTADAPIDPDRTPAAHHAVELAALVAEARTAGVSVAALLGAPAVATVAVNATVGVGPPARVADAVRRVVDAGYRTVKLKLTGDLTDVDRLVAAADAAGDARLRADCNGAADRATAAAICAAAADVGVEFIEQPLPAAELDGLAELAATGCPIAVDEGLAQHDLTAIADAGVAVVICKPMVHGGPRATLRLAAEARAVGLDCVVTTTYDAAIARTAAAHVAAAIGGPFAHGVATGGRVATDIAPDPLTVIDGTVRIGTTVGLGGLAARRYDSGV
jgi:L-alanine-DL-glutamate epimerase and related enzymes of enolase superfamily